MITSNLFAIRDGMMASKAVGTRSTDTPMSFASLAETSISKPIHWPCLSRIAQGMKLPKPTTNLPRFLMLSKVLSCCASAGCKHNKGINKSMARRRVINFMFELQS